MNRAYFNGLKVVAKQIPPADLFLLDLFPGAAGAYSLRKLRAAYTGAAIRVRRSSDDAEQDIGFDGEDLDTAALLAFVGSEDGFVSVIYDQSTNANNASQSIIANQPPIVSSGVVNVLNGKPCMVADNRISEYNFPLLTQINTVTNTYSVSSSFNTGNRSLNAMYGAATTGNPGLIMQRFDSGPWPTGAAITSLQLKNLNEQYITTFREDVGSAIIKVNNNSDNNLGTFTPIIIQRILARRVNQDILNGQFQELIIYPSTQGLSDVDAIRSNLNNYYNVF